MTVMTDRTLPAGSPSSGAFLTGLLAWLRMLWFQVRQFARVGYFIQLMAVSTISAALLQRLALGAQSASQAAVLLPPDVWLRTAEIGLWSTCTAAAGIIGMQRWQGVLGPLLVGQRSAASTLSTVVAAAATFGLLAFPLAALSIWALSGFQAGAVSLSLSTLLGALLVWFGAVASSFVIASIFVLTPNAITYEVLLLVPILLLSGIFGFPTWLPSSARLLSLVFPFTGGVQFLAAGVERAQLPLPAWSLALSGLLVSLLWLGLARLLLAACLRKAQHDGSLEIQ